LFLQFSEARADGCLQLRIELDGLVEVGDGPVEVALPVVSVAATNIGGSIVRL
jgi:hypothetical protein